MKIEDISPDLIAKQLELEEGMTQRGAERYLRSVSRAVEKGREHEVDYSQQIMAARVGVLSSAIGRWIEETGQGKACGRALAYLRIKDMDPTVLSFLAIRGVLHSISSQRTLQYVARFIGMTVEDELRLAKLRSEERLKYERLIKNAAKRVSANNKHVYATRHADGIQQWEPWTNTDRLHVGVRLLDLLMQTIGLVEVVTAGATTRGNIKYVVATKETLEWIEQKRDASLSFHPFFDPMVVPPRDWTSPWDGGYLSSAIKPLRMVKTGNWAYQQELGEIDMPIVYEALNAIQRTPWRINRKVLEVMESLWDVGNPIAGMPPRDGTPIPPKPHDIETNEVALKSWRISAARTYSDNLSLLGQRVHFSMILGTAKRYAEYERIYFPYQLDFRGRIYAVTSLTPQGSDPTKSLLQFAEGKPLGSEGWKWLAIQGANLAGYDKASLEDRVNWVMDHEEEILRIADDPHGNRGWCGEVGGVRIDKPWQFLAFCFDWAGYCESGEAYVSGLPVAMDGSCSGIQHFSAMLRDEVGGAAVNLTPADLPKDVYGLVCAKVLEQMAEDLEGGTEDALKHTDEDVPYVVPGTKKLAAQWKAFGVTRKTTKRSVMTVCYGSKEYGFKEQLMEDILRPAHHAATRPDGSVDDSRFPFDGDGFRAAAYMAGLIWRAVREVLVAAGEAMSWLQDAARLVTKENLPVRWTTPVGFPVMQAYRDVTPFRVKTAINGKIVKLIMNKETAHLDKRKQTQGISPNFVHSCDAAHMMLTVVRATQEGISSFSMIHDSFGTTAGDVEDLFRIVREAFVEMYSEVDVLGNFRDELQEQMGGGKELPELPEKGTLDLGGVVESRFCFA